ncbi:amidase signature domain-containing protein [Xylariomycetidae sp. FL2044]|nr:amidase signature domain-containing protein [Xylariomycetidae sp. FL2044]
MARLPGPGGAIAAPFRSPQAFREFCRAPATVEGQAMIGNPKWSNRDLEPTHPEERTWNWYNLPTYWFTTAFGSTGWNVAASLIAVGLTWQQAFVSAVLGSLIAALAVVGMARPGVMYHIGYPVISRTAMGMYGSYFFIAIRAVVCIIWYGIQTFYGANLLSVCFRCIFGGIWHDWPNSLPASADVTSKQLLGFFLVWLAEFPFMFIHPSKIQLLFTVKGFMMPVATFGLFGWCMAYGAGIGSLDLANERGAEAAKKTPLGWAIMSGINVILGTLSPMLVNQPDLARYCRKPWHAGSLQGVAVFFTKVIVLWLGLASTASMQGAWGEAYWNIWNLLDAILDHYWTPGARAGVFFVSFTYLFGVFGSNFGANSIPFGADLTGLSPRYMTIKRGQVLCAILGVAVVPWKLLANASAFISFLGSYNIFMAPLCAIIIFDYVFVKKGNIHVPSMYDGRKGGLYWFWSGVNWVGVFSWLGGVSFGLPGLVAQYQPQAVSQTGKNMYYLGWILTFTAAGVIYLVLTRMVKMRVYPAGFESVPVIFEYLAKEGRGGFFEGERENDAASSEALTKFKDGSLTVEDYARSLLSRIEERDATVKAWAYLDPDYVIEQAKKLDQIPPEQRGPLHGVAIAVKDVIYTKDMPTQFNSPIYEGDAPKVDAGSIITLRHAGALILGKTTTTEFASTRFGPKTCNPHDPKRTPGGSSSGSGAAVGDFQAPIGLGTQTGGSTIRPGSYNGIYAMKPTWNSITREGQKIYSLIFDTLGLYARSVEDLELLADVFALEDDEAPNDDFSLKGAKFALLKTMVWPQVGKGTQDAMEAGAKLLKKHGAEVEEIELPPDFDNMPEWHRIVLHSDGRPAFLPEYRIAKDKLSSFLVEHVENSTKISRADQLKAFDGMAALRPKIDEIAGKYAAIITPSVPDEAPVGTETTGSAAFNSIWTAFHTPVVNIPGFEGENGMPIGLSLVAPRYHDRHLLAVSKVVGKVFEEEGGWKSKV